MDVNTFQERTVHFQEELISFAWGAEEVPKVNLLHYTGVEGLCGILESRTLWAGHLGFMNDRTELDYAYKLMKPIYDERIEKHGGPCQKLLKPFSPEKFQVDKEFDVYALCLTEAKDDLAAWMTYGRAGRGYALEFDLSRRGVGDTMKVVYDEDEQRQLLKNILDKACQFIDGISKEKVKGGSEELQSRLTRNVVIAVHKALATCAPRFKHHSFRQEHEWRLLAVRQKGTEKEKPERFRTSGTIAAPFFEFSFEDLGVQQGSPNAIWLGPNVDDFGVRSVELLCSRFGHKEVDVKRSDIPLRTVK